MSDEPKSFWGKLALITAFLTALIGLATLFSQCPNGNNYAPPSRTNTSIPETKVPSVPTIPSVQMGNFCCDVFGNRRCNLIVPTPIGSSCFCYGQQGYGVVCQ